MAQNARLVIGAGIIDSAQSGSTSTIAGAIFAFKPEGFTVRSTPEADEIPFRLRLAVADTATAKSRVQDILDLLDTIATEGIIIEYDNGSTLVELDPATVASIDYETAITYTAQGADIEVTVRAENIDANAIGTGSWQVQRNPAGRMFVVGSLYYADLATAIADVAAMRSGATKPAWMPASCRVVQDDSESVKAQGALNGMAAANFRPCTMTVAWEQMPSHLHNSAAFANVKRAKWTVNAKPRDPLNTRAGNKTGLNVEINATLEFKTESGTAYDTADPAGIAGAAMHAAALACAAVIKSEAEARSGTTITIMEDYGRNVTGEDGVYTITLIGVTEGATRVLSWEESETYEETFRGQFIECSDGSEWEFEHSGGDLKMVQHSLEIVSLGAPRAYAPPISISGPNWRRIYLGDSPPHSFNAGTQGARQYRRKFQRTYRYVNPGKGGGAEDRRTVAGGEAPASAESPTGHVGQFG